MGRLEILDCRVVLYERRMPAKQNIEVYDAVIKPAMLYGRETGLQHINKENGLR